MKALIFLVSLIGSTNCFSQDYTQFWLRTTVQYKINSKLTSSLELHHRTQSLAGRESPFRYPLTNAFRFWLSFKLSERETIHFSPYAFFSNDPLAKNEDEALSSNANEHRIHLQYEHKMPVGKYWSLDSRYGGEYRIFESNTDLFRLRFREAINYKISKNIGIQLYDELFLNTINAQKNHIFDQNRIGLISNFSLFKKLKLELGTSVIQSLTRNGSNSLNNIMIQSNIKYVI